MGGLPRVQHIDAVIGGDGPVVMFAGAIDPGEGLLMEQAGEAMASGYLL